MKRLPDFFRRRRWTVKGYYAYPITYNDRDLPGFEQWLEFDNILRDAKNGNFSNIPKLVDLLSNPDDWVREGEYLQLLGDAGSYETLSQVLKNFPVGLDIVFEFGLAQTLEYWGHLSVIPVLIDMYERYNFSEDSMYIPPALSRLMEGTPSEIQSFPPDKDENAIKDYCRMVRHRYLELCSRLGTNDAIVFRGKVIEIKHVCHRMLEDMRYKNRFHEEMRHKFEAYTGIDCSDFYSQGNLQPLEAASIIEKFLNSSEVEKFQKGTRYFFGYELG